MPNLINTQSAPEPATGVSFIVDTAMRWARNYYNNLTYGSWETVSPIYYPFVLAGKMPYRVWVRDTDTFLYDQSNLLNEIVHCLASSLYVENVRELNMVRATFLFTLGRFDLANLFNTLLSSDEISRIQSGALNALADITSGGVVAGLSATFLSGLNYSAISQTRVSFFNQIQEATWRQVSVSFFNALPDDLLDQNFYTTLNCLPDDKVAQLSYIFLNRLSQATIDMMINTPTSYRAHNFSNAVPKNKWLLLDGVKYRALLQRATLNDVANLITADARFIRAAALNALPSTVVAGLPATFLNKFASKSITNGAVGLSVDFLNALSPTVVATLLSSLPSTTAVFALRIRSTIVVSLNENYAPLRTYYTPTISISSDCSLLSTVQNATLTFTLSTPSTGFAVADVSVVGGVLSGFTGSDVSYTAIFTPSANRASNASIYVLASTFTGTYTSLNNNASSIFSMAVDTVVPDAPRINNLIASDNIINAVEKAAGVAVGGTTEANASILVTWGNINKTTVASSTGSWSTTFANSEIPDDSPLSTISAVATDTAGNVGFVATSSVVIDTLAPDAPRIDPITFNGSENAIVISGVAEINACVLVTWSGVTKTVFATDPGLISAFGNNNYWSATFARNEIPTGNAINTLSAVVIDVAGNVSERASGSALVDAVVPVLTGITSNKTILNTVGSNILTFTFSENVTGFTRGSITLSQGTVLGVVGSGNIYTAVYTLSQTVTSMTVSVAASKFSDLVGNRNTAAFSQVMAVDIASPSVTSITASKSLLNIGSTAIVTFRMSESVIGFTSGNINVIGGASLSGLMGTGSSYTAILTPNIGSNLPVSISISAGKFTDVAGNSNKASTVMSVAIDTIAPTAQINTLSFSNDTGISATDFITNSQTQIISGTLNSALGSGEVVEVSIDNGATWEPTVVTLTGAVTTFATSNVTLSSDSTKRTIVARVRDVAGNVGNIKSQAYTLDMVAPNAPTINIVAQDDKVNAAERSSGVLVSGTAQAGAFVVVAWGSANKTVTVAADGTWNTRFEGADPIYPDINNAVYALTRDTAGNQSIATRHNVVIDVTAPNAPSNFWIPALQDGISANEAEQGVDIIVDLSNTNAVVGDKVFVYNTQSDNAIANTFVTLSQENINKNYVLITKATSATYASNSNFYVLIQDQAGNASNINSVASTSLASLDIEKAQILIAFLSQTNTSSLKSLINTLSVTQINAVLTQFVNASSAVKNNMLASMNVLFNNIDTLILLDVDKTLLKNSLADANASGLSASFLNNISPIIYTKLQNSELSVDFFNNLSVTAVAGFDTDFLIEFINGASTALLSSIGSNFFQHIDSKIIWSLSSSDTTKLQTVLGKLLPDAILGLSVEQSAGLTFAASIKPISLLTATQLAQVSVNSVQTIPGLVLSELDATKLASLSVDSLLNLTADQLTSLSEAQIDAINVKQVPALLMTRDQLANLTPATLAKLTQNTIASLVPQQFLALLPNIRNLSSTQIARISYKVLTELNDAQLHSFSQDQLLALDPVTLSLLDSQTKRSLQNISTLNATHHWNQAQINSLTSMSLANNVNANGDVRIDLLKAQDLANRREYMISSAARTFIEAKYQNLSFKIGAAPVGVGPQQVRQFFKDAYARSNYASRHYSDSLRKAYQGARLIGSALQIAAAVMVFNQSNNEDRSDLEQNADILQGMAWLSASFKVPAAVLYGMYKKYGIAYTTTYDARLDQITENDQSYINAYHGVYEDIVTKLKNDPIQKTAAALTEQQINTRAEQLAQHETKIAVAKLEASVAGKAAVLPSIADSLGLTTITDFFKFRKEIKAARGAAVNPLALRGGTVVNTRVINVLPAGGAAVPAPVAQAVAARIDGILWRTSGSGAKTSSWVRGMIRGGVIQTIANSLAVASAIYQTVEASEDGDGLAMTFNVFQVVGSTLTLGGELGPTLFQKTPMLQRRSINVLRFGQIITFTALTAYDVIDSFVKLKNNPSMGANWRAVGSVINAAISAGLLIGSVVTGGLSSVIFTLAGLFLPNWATVGQLVDVRNQRVSLRGQGRLVEADVIYDVLEGIAYDRVSSFGWTDGDAENRLSALVETMNEIGDSGESRISEAIAQYYHFAIQEQIRTMSPEGVMVNQLRQHITNSATATQKIISMRVLNGEAVEAKNYYAASQTSALNHNYILDLTVTADSWTTNAYDAASLLAIDFDNWGIRHDPLRLAQAIVLQDTAATDVNSYELVKVAASSVYGYLTSLGAGDHTHPTRIPLIVDARTSSSSRMYSISSNNIFIKGGTGSNQYYIDGDTVSSYRIEAQDKTKNDVFITALDTSSITINLDEIIQANVSVFAGNVTATGTTSGQSLFARSHRNTISMTGGSSAITCGGRGNHVTMGGGGNIANIVLGWYLIDGAGYDHQGNIDGGAYTGAGVIPTDAYNRINFAAATQGITLDLTSTGNVTSSIASMYDLNNTTRKIDEVSFTNFQEIVGSNLNDTINISNRSDIAALTLGVGTNVVDIANSSNLSIFTSGGIDDIFIHNVQSTVAQNIYLHTANGESNVVLGSYARLAADLNGLSDIIDLTASATADINYIKTGSGFHKILLNQSCSGFIEITAESRNNHTVVYEKNDQRAAGHEMVINIGSLMSQSYINYDSSSALISIYASDGSGNYLDFYAKPHDIPTTPVSNTSSYASHVYVGIVNDADNTLPMSTVDSSLLIQAMQILGDAHKTSFNFQGQNKTAFTMASVFQETQVLIPTPVHS